MGAGSGGKSGWSLVAMARDEEEGVLDLERLGSEVEAGPLTGDLFIDSRRGFRLLADAEAAAEVEAGPLPPDPVGFFIFMELLGLRKSSALSRVSVKLPWQGGP